jgi:hypothetical protein
VLSLTDPRWGQFQANYTDGNQVAELLARAESGEASHRWYDDLFQELCHQYTVSEAAFPAAHHLARLATAREELRVDLLLLLGACHTFAEPSRLASIPSEMVDEWEDSAKDALPLIADLLAQRRTSVSELLYLLSALAAVGGYPALARNIEAIDYEEE